MQTNSLTSFHQILRRVLVGTCVIFTLGIAGTVVGRAASQEDVKPVVAVAEAATPEVAPVKAAPSIIQDVVTLAAAPELLVSFLQAAPAAPTVRTIEMEVTAYCPCKKCCGPKAQGLTASGKRVSHNDGQFVAADKRYKFGTKLLIPGYASGKSVEVLDRGGAIKGNKLDVYFPSHTEALKWGRQKLTVTVIE